MEARPTDETTPLDELFDLLAHPRRRRALGCLCEQRAPVALADLAREVAAREQGTAITDVAAEDAKRVSVSLYHSHLPKLADADVVEYDPERGTAALSAERERIERFVGRAGTDE